MMFNDDISEHHEIFATNPGWCCENVAGEALN